MIIAIFFSEFNLSLSDSNLELILLQNFSLRPLSVNLIITLSKSLFIPFKTSPIRQPFNPNYVLEFSKDDMKAFYWVSLGTGEIALSDSKGNFKCFIMRDFERIDSLFRNVIKNK